MIDSRKTGSGPIWSYIAVTLMLFILATPGWVNAESESPKDLGERASPGFWKNKVYDWYLNPNGRPVWLSEADAERLVKAAAAVWEICGLQMRYRGMTNAVPGRMDGLNVFGWNEKLPKGMRGLTVGTAKNEQLLERDIMVRPDRQEFEVYPNLLRKVVSHEFGHAIGLTHSTRCDDVMTLAAECPPKDPSTLPTALTTNDLRRCRALYAPQSVQ